MDSNLNLLKGGGACMLQEKLVASNAKKFVVVADYRKISKRLGEGVCCSFKCAPPVLLVHLFPVPVVETRCSYRSHSIGVRPHNEGK